MSIGRSLYWVKTRPTLRLRERGTIGVAWTGGMCWCGLKEVVLLLHYGTPFRTNLVYSCCPLPLTAVIAIYFGRRCSCKENSSRNCSAPGWSTFVPNSTRRLPYTYVWKEVVNYWCHHARFTKTRSIRVFSDAFTYASYPPITCIAVCFYVRQPNSSFLR